MNNDLTKPYMCITCGHHKDVLDGKCPNCSSERIIPVQLAKDYFGDNYMRCFEEKKAA